MPLLRQKSSGRSDQVNYKSKGRKWQNFIYLPKTLHYGRGGGQVISVLYSFSDDLSLNPAEI